MPIPVPIPQPKPMEGDPVTINQLANGEQFVGRFATLTAQAVS